MKNKYLEITTLIIGLFSICFAIIIDEWQLALLGCLALTCIEQDAKTGKGVGQ